MTTPTYPKRPSHFAHKAVRAMVKTCVAQEHGQGVFALLCVIAHTEDARHYTSPVTFWNEQLAAVAGFANVKAMDRQRANAVESGWLVYLPGGNRKPGRYWVSIPPRFSKLDDAPSDEGPVDESEVTEMSPVQTSNLTNEVGHEVGNEPGMNRDRSGNRTGIEVGNEPGSNRAPFYPIPNPIPFPIPPPTPTGLEGQKPEASSADLPTESPDLAELLDTTTAELIARWNGLRGVLPYRRRVLGYSERATLERWLIGADRLDWRAVLDKFPLRAFPPGLDGGWQPSLRWLLTGENAWKVLDGEYDFTPGVKPQQAAAPRRRVRLGDSKTEGGGP